MSRLRWLLISNDFDLNLSKYFIARKFLKANFLYQSYEIWFVRLRLANVIKLDYVYVMLSMFGFVSQF